MKTKTIAILTVVALAAICMPANADPLPNQILKFQQLPMDGTPIPDGAGIITKYYGHDEESTAYLDAATGGYFGNFMADDFADKFNTPVVHVSWWGSYMGAQSPDLAGVKKFAIVFESDVPAGSAGNNFSHPGNVLQAQTVVKGPLSPGSGTFTETPVSPGGAPLDEALYKYNAELRLPFQEDNDTVYWLKIVALVDDVNAGIRWGWHNRDYTIMDPLASALVVPGEVDEQPIIDPSYPSPVWHFQDDAVSGPVALVPNAAGGLDVEQAQSLPQQYVDGVDGPGSPLGLGIGKFSKDLAFELYTVPEPATMFLLVTGGLAMLRRRKH